MEIVVVGATGATGLLVCRQALAAGHCVRAVTRRPDPFPITDPALTVVRADAVSGKGMTAAVSGADAVLSSLGASYTRREVTVYSAGVRHLVEGIRAGARGARLVVVSAGLAYPPPGDAPFPWLARHVAFPLLRNVFGRTLYAGMRRMEHELLSCDDVAWTVLRPGRLVDDDAVSSYRLDEGFPTQGVTVRGDLAAALLAEVGPRPHVHGVLAPTTR